MADELIIDVGANISGADAQFGKLNKEINQLDGHLGRVSKSGGGFSGMLGKVGGGLTSMLNPIGLLAGGIGVLGAGLVAAGKAAAEEQVGMDRLQQTLKNSVKGYSDADGAVEKYIGKMTNLAFADDELRDSLNHLVGQTKDLGEAQALQATAMDLARAKGISLKDATKAVGKVDQESIGILKKLGIQVTDNMTKEEALTAIREQSAGQAEKYAKSAAGSMERVQNAFGDAIEDIGGVVLPALTTAMGTFADLLSGELDFGTFLGQVVSGLGSVGGAVLGWIGAQAGPIVAKLSEWATAFVAWIGPLIPTWLAKAAEFLGSVLAWLGQQIPILIEAVAGWARAFIDWIAPMIPVWITAALGFLGSVLGWLGEQVPVIAAKIAEWASAFWQWLVEVVPIALGKLGEFLTSVIGWLGENLPTIVAKLVEWGTAFIGWILPMIPPLLLKLGELLVAIGGWIIDTALPGLAKMLLEWVGAFLGWIGPIITQLPGKLADIASKVWSWITDTAKTLGTKVGEFVGEFWTWIVDVIKGIGDYLGGIAGSIWTWISDTATDIGYNILEFVTAFWGWITKTVSDIGTKLGDIAAKIWEWVTTTASDIYTKALDIGTNLVKGMWDGFASIMPGFSIAGAEGMQKMIDAAKEQAGEHSPSTVFHEIGQNLVQGLINGVNAMLATASAVMIVAAAQLIAKAHITLGTAGGASSVFMSIGQLLMAGLQSGIDANSGLAVNAMKTQVSKLLPTARGNLGDFTTVGAAISAGVNQGINNTWGGVVNNIMGKARALAAQAKAALDIRSPSHVFEEIGESMMAGWARGIERGTGTVVDALAGAVTSIIKNPISDIMLPVSVAGGMVATDNQVIVYVDGVRVPTRTTSSELGDRRRAKSRGVMA